MLLTVTVIAVPTAFGFSLKVIMMTSALVVKTSVTFNYSSPAQDRSQSENQSKAYQVQMKHYALIFYVLRLSALEQYFNVWHTVLKYLEPFFFFNFIILRCLNGLNSPPLCLNDSKVFVFHPSLKDRKKKEHFIC